MGGGGGSLQEIRASEGERLNFPLCFVSQVLKDVPHRGGWTLKPADGPPPFGRLKYF